MTIQTTTSSLQVYTQGDEHEDTILLISGGPGVPDYLNEVALLLQDHYRVIQFDQRGVANSVANNDEYEIDQYCSDISAIMEHFDLQKIHIFGHSWGGLYAQIYASKYPDKTKSLFLCSPSSGSGHVWQEMEKEVMIYNKSKATRSEWLKMGFHSLGGMLGMDKSYHHIFGEVWRYYFEEPDKAPPADEVWLKGIHAKAINRTRKNIINYDSEKLDKDLSELSVPVMVTYGAYDIYGSSKSYTFERLPTARQYQFDQAGHLPWIQSHGEFQRVLQGFYSQFSDMQFINK